MLHSELKQAREAAGISQSEMADRLEVSRHTYMRWEAGKTAKLPGDLAARVRDRKADAITAAVGETTGAVSELGGAARVDGTDGQTVG